MNIRVNGAPLQVEATTLRRLIDELDYEDSVVATAVNQTFVRRKDRAETALREGDEVEILTPRQGG